MEHLIYLLSGAALLALGMCIMFIMDYKNNSHKNKHIQITNEQQIRLTQEGTKQLNIQAQMQFVALDHDEKMAKLEMGD